MPKDIIPTPLFRHTDEDLKNISYGNDYLKKHSEYPYFEIHPEKFTLTHHDRAMGFNFPLDGKHMTFGPFPVGRDRSITYLNQLPNEHIVRSVDNFIKYAKYDVIKHIPEYVEHFRNKEQENPRKISIDEKSINNELERSLNSASNMHYQNFIDNLPNHSDYYEPSRYLPHIGIFHNYIIPYIYRNDIKTPIRKSVITNNEIADFFKHLNKYIPDEKQKQTIMNKVYIEKLNPELHDRKLGSLENEFLQLVQSKHPTWSKPHIWDTTLEFLYSIPGFLKQHHDNYREFMRDRMGLN